jgi:hypothetical protein
MYDHARVRDTRHQCAIKEPGDWVNSYRNYVPLMAPYRTVPTVTEN